MISTITLPAIRPQLATRTRAAPAAAPNSQGLSQAEAEARLRTYGRNQLPDGEQTSPLKRIAGQFKDPFSLLLLPACGVSAAMGDYGDAIGIGVVSVLNAGIGYVQESHAQKSMDALKALMQHSARVLRDGRASTIAAAEVVPGDLILLQAGDIVPADAKLVESQDLLTDEAALTGEALPVRKDAHARVDDQAPLHSRVDTVFSGTTVRGGSGMALVTSTGVNTEIGRIAQTVRQAKPPPTPLEEDQEQVARRFMWLGGVSSALVGTSAALAGHSIMAAVAPAISTLVAVVPESLPTVTSLVLASGIREARSRNVLIRNLASVETLGSTTVVCTDKTGTLTSGEMEGELMWATSAESQRWSLLGALAGNRAARDGDKWVGSPTEIAMLKFLEKLPQLQVQSTPYKGGGGQLDVRYSDGVAERFTLTAEQMAAVPTDGKPTTTLLALGEALRAGSRDYPFSSERKLHTVAIPASTLGGSGYLALTSGAPDRVLPLVTSLTPQQREQVRLENDKLAQGGYRVLALAHRHIDKLGEADEVERDLVFSGLMAIRDPLRDGVAESVSELRRAGVAVMVITGDQMLTARSIAQDAGILSTGKKQFHLTEDLLTQLDASTEAGRQALDQALLQAEAADEVMVAGKWLDLFKDDKDPKVIGIFGNDRLQRLMRNTRVAYRVEPRHKLRLVRTLQGMGQTVAMTGDGVNDAAAIKAANIGVAMGIRGTDASKAAAQMILTDDSFNSIANGVKVGRLIQTNIRKSISYILSSNLGEVGAVGLTSIAGLAMAHALPPMLTPLQLLWINLATDSLPALALGKEPAERELMAEGPRPVGQGLLNPRRMKELIGMGTFMGASAAGLYLLGHAGGGAWAAAAQTMAFQYLCLGQCANAINFRKEGKTSVLADLGKNKLLLGTVVGTAALQAALPHIPGLGEALRVVPLSWPQWLAVGAASAAVLPVGWVLKRAFSDAPSGGAPPSAPTQGGARAARLIGDIPDYQTLR